MADKNYVKTIIKNQVATIEFYTEQSNSLPSDILIKISDAIKESDANEKVKLIKIKSSGERAFCAGANFNELLHISTSQQGKDFFMGFANVINACRLSSKLIIGRVHGKSVGGGVGIIAATDYCFATQYSSIRLSELSLGIAPFVIEPAIVKKTSLNTFQKMVLHPDKWYHAQWAEENGFFQELFKDNQAMDIAIREFEDKICNMNPLALAELKKVFWRNTEKWGDLLEKRAEISGNLVLSDFTKKYINNFK